MGEKKYIQLIPLDREDFATSEMHEAAVCIHPLLSQFAHHVNDVKCSHRKRYVKIVEKALRMKPDQDLNLDFDSKKADNASLQEICLKPTSEQNADFGTASEALRKGLKATSNSSEFDKKSFEHLVFSKLEELTVHFYNSVQEEDPEAFHKEAKTWLHGLNSARLKVRVPIAVHAEY